MRENDRRAQRKGSARKRKRKVCIVYMCQRASACIGRGSMVYAYKNIGDTRYYHVGSVRDLDYEPGNRCESREASMHACGGFDLKEVEQYRKHMGFCLKSV